MFYLKYLLSKTKSLSLKFTQILFIGFISYICFIPIYVEAKSNLSLIKKHLESVNKELTPINLGNGLSIIKYEIKNKVMIIHFTNDETVYTMSNLFSEINEFKSAFRNDLVSSVNRDIWNLLMQEGISMQLKIKSTGKSKLLCNIDINNSELEYGVKNPGLRRFKNKNDNSTISSTSDLSNKETDNNKNNYLKSNIDSNIPHNKTNNHTTTFAVIIANENYHFVSNVPYANNDGEILKKYLTYSVGLPEDHVKLFLNASYGNMAAALKHIENLSEAFGNDLNLIFYYSGHGIPDEKTKNPMLIPVDGDSSIPETCYELDKLISNLGGLNAKSVIVMLDACFSGTERGDGMLMAARGIRIKSNQSEPIGNMVIFSASQSNETAYPYEAEQHGMFTYFLLKKLQEKKADITLGELSDYIVEKVKQQSVVTNGKLQTPSISVSPQMEDRWRDIKFGEN